MDALATDDEIDAVKAVGDATDGSTPVGIVVTRGDAGYPLTFPAPRRHARVARLPRRVARRARRPPRRLLLRFRRAVGSFTGATDAGVCPVEGSTWSSPRAVRSTSPRRAARRSSLTLRAALRRAPPPRARGRLRNYAADGDSRPQPAVHEGLPARGDQGHAREVCTAPSPTLGRPRRARSTSPRHDDGPAEETCA